MQILAHVLERLEAMVHLDDVRGVAVADPCLKGLETAELLADESRPLGVRAVVQRTMERLVGVTRALEPEPSGDRREGPSFAA